MSKPFGLAEKLSKVLFGLIPEVPITLYSWNVILAGIKDYSIKCCFSVIICEWRFLCPSLAVEGRQPNAWGEFIFYHFKKSTFTKKFQKIERNEREIVA